MRKMYFDWKGSGQQLYDLTHIQKYPSEVISEQFNFIENSLKNTIMENKNDECGKCFGSGKLTISNLTDDFDVEYCTCPIGRELEAQRDSDSEPLD
jgi:hypothetical protein